MSSADSASRVATCTNVIDCWKAITGESLAWYPGAGEYCPECGEALALGNPVSLAAEPPRLPPKTHTDSPPGPVALGHRRPQRKPRMMASLRWFWIVAATVLAGAAVAYAERRAPASTDRASTDAVTVCPIPSAQQLAADIVRGYAAKSGAPRTRFVLGNANRCDVRFAAAAGTPDAVIARDGIVAIVNRLNPISRISEQQLRAIFSGSIRDWSQLGGPHAPIVPILPDPASDEAKVLGSSLFFGVGIDRGVRRASTSADVTRAVTGADNASRGSIGLVAFSQAVPAKVVPLAYLPPPNVLSIATRRYPYTLTIAVESSSRMGSAAAGLVEYARSSAGAAIVAKDRLVGRASL